MKQLLLNSTDTSGQYHRYLKTYRKAIVSLYVFGALWGCVPAIQIGNDPIKLHESASYVGKGVLALRAGNLEEASAAFNLAKELYPSASAADGLGCVAFRRKDYRQAEQHFLKALEMDESYASAHANLALLYELKNSRKKALGNYLKALQLQPSNYRSRNNYAAHLYDSNLVDLARHELLKAKIVRGVDEPIVHNLKETESNESKFTIRSNSYRLK